MPLIECHALHDRQRRLVGFSDQRTLFGLEIRVRMRPMAVARASYTLPYRALH